MNIVIKRTHIINALIWAPIVFLSGLLIWNSLAYYFNGLDFGILPEKTEAINDPIWLVCFYVHVGFSCLILALPLFQFWIRIKTANRKKWHAIIGKAYVYTTLLIVCPTGIYMSFYAKGGAWTKIGFFMQGLALFWFTWKGFVEIRKGHVSKHVEWMIRSYLLTLSALTFRLYHLLFHYLGLEYFDNYNASQWLSVMGNILIAEFIIQFIRNKKASKQQKLNKQSL